MKKRGFQKTGARSTWRFEISTKQGKRVCHVAAYVDGRPLQEISLPGRRWGSVLGPQRTGLEVFNPSGRPFRIPRVVVDRALQPWVVKKGIYGGVRR